MAKSHRMPGLLPAAPGLLLALAAALLAVAGPIAGCGGDDDSTNPPIPEGTLVASVSLPTTAISGAGVTLRVRGGYCATAGDTSWTAGVAVSVAVTGGAAGSASGQTGAGGIFTTTVTADVLGDESTWATAPESLAVEVTVSNATADTVISRKAEIWEAGLLTRYSTGSSYMEGPVFNGYWTDCTATEHNFYQGVCTPMEASPVNWAWGTFSATWDGYLYSGAGGDTNFRSWYWVDGVITIEIDGTVVADLSTPGGGYSKVLTLPADTWLPVHMTFAGNGGSNNMHLGWTSPTVTEWEAVPRANLATPRSWLREGVPGR